MAAALLLGAVLGVVLAIAAAALHHCLAARDEFGRVAKVALGAFIATSVIPGLKYPANPPTVGNPDTIGQRTSNYLLLMAAAILSLFAAFVLWQYLSDRGVTGGSRFLLGGGGFVLLVTIAMVTFPASPDAINPPNSDAATALEISDSAPPEVLDHPGVRPRGRGRLDPRSRRHGRAPRSEQRRQRRGPGRRPGGDQHHQAGPARLQHDGLALPNAVARRGRSPVGGHGGSARPAVEAVAEVAPELANRPHRQAVRWRDGVDTLVVRGTCCLLYKVAGPDSWFDRKASQVEAS